MRKFVLVFLLHLSVGCINTFAGQGFAIIPAQSDSLGTSPLINATLLTQPPALKIKSIGTQITTPLGQFTIITAIQKKYADALRIFQTSKAASKDTLWPLPPLTKQQLDSLYTLYLTTEQPPKATPSTPIKLTQVIRLFNDHKKAVAYGFYLHVKQPVPGKRKRFKWFGQVGHCFVTLIKYNQDGTYVSSTYGFYPKKWFVLQATPLLPWAPADFKNDDCHNWDESLGSFITHKQFNKIMRITRRYARKSYHLSRANCTDFALALAKIGGISVEQTKGSWPLGQGNDPGDTGQSILEQRFTSTTNSTLFCVFSPELAQNRCPETN